MKIYKIFFRFKRYANKIKFRIFEGKINNKTWENHEKTLRWAETSAKQPDEELQKQIQNSSDFIVLKGQELRQKELAAFKDKHRDKNIKVLIHLPSKETSPGGYSLFGNMAESFNFLGIETEFLFVGEDINEKLNQFRPTIFLSSDHKSYTSKIDWNIIKEFKKSHNLQVGLTASIEEYGNTPLRKRLNWAKSAGIDFYYSFRAHKYIMSREQYKPFFDFGYRILSIEFGANPLQYFPVPSTTRDLDYVFLASSNGDKQKRYFNWLPKLVYKHTGFIDGPGWHKLNRWASQPSHKFLYSRAKIGINLHNDDSMDWASQLNERNYIIEAR